MRACLLSDEAPDRFTTVVEIYKFFSITTIHQLRLASLGAGLGQDNRSRWESLAPIVTGDF